MDFVKKIQAALNDGQEVKIYKAWTPSGYVYTVTIVGDCAIDESHEDLETAINNAFDRYDKFCQQ